MIELNIDGNLVEVEQGTSVLDAARKAGVEVPTLCHHPDLTAFGGCRLCLVEIEGRRAFRLPAPHQRSAGWWCGRIPKRFRDCARPCWSFCSRSIPARA